MPQEVNLFGPSTPAGADTSNDTDADIGARIVRTIDGDTSHVWLSGDIDLAVVQPLLSITTDEPRCETCRTHLAEVTFIDCAGLGALIVLQRHVRARNARFELADPSPPATRLLQLVDPDGQLFTVSAAHPGDSRAALDDVTLTLCGAVEPVGTDGEWHATCPQHRWHGAIHRSQQQAALDLAGHRATATATSTPGPSPSPTATDTFGTPPLPATGPTATRPVRTEATAGRSCRTRTPTRPTSSMSSK